VAFCPVAFYPVAFCPGLLPMMHGDSSSRVSVQTRSSADADKPTRRD